MMQEFFYSNSPAAKKTDLARHNGLPIRPGPRCPASQLPRAISRTFCANVRWLQRPGS